MTSSLEGSHLLKYQLVALQVMFVCLVFFRLKASASGYFPSRFPLVFFQTLHGALTAYG
jgi:hypothetical protein